ncbi:MAG: XRE family transcriptional regulator [Faecalibacterium sp.]|nr:XRE family transcriptional regulator [Faecalibacterium sp.]
MEQFTTQGQRIRQMRRQKRYTQDYVAAQLNTTKQAIYKYETDIVHNIPPEKLEKLARLLGCSAAYLQGLTDDPGAMPADRALPPSSPLLQQLTETVQALPAAEQQTVLQFARFLAANTGIISK